MGRPHSAPLTAQTSGLESIPGFASLDEVLKSVATATSITSVSSNLLASNLNSGNLLVGSSCDPVNPSIALHPTPCFFGDTKTKRTVVLYGDSIAGSWLPNLAVVAEHLQFRLAVFRYAGCPPPFLPFTLATGGPVPLDSPRQGALWQQCANWHERVAGAVRRLSPEAVVIVSGAWNSSGGDFGRWIGGMKSAFTAMTKGNPRAKRILIGTSPLLPESVPECLSVHLSSIETCDLHYRTNPADYYGEQLVRDQDIASASRATLIPVVSWFCYRLTCPPVIGNSIVYVDRDHTTIQYSQYLTGAMYSALSRLLPRGFSG